MWGRNDCLFSITYWQSNFFLLRVLHGRKIILFSTNFWKLVENPPAEENHSNKISFFLNKFQNLVKNIFEHFFLNFTTDP